MRFITPSFLSLRDIRNVSDGSGFGGFATNLLAISVIASVIIFFSIGGDKLDIPISDITYQKIVLDISSIPNYAFHTTFRMLMAIIASVIFSIIYGTLAAKSQKLEEVLVPFLDILQSVPVLGYISFTLTAFVSLAPNTVMGLEFAVIFAIFTSQAWNLAFCIYQSLKSIPPELQESALILKLNSWQRFWRLELPYCVPNIIWNMTVSMSGGWFFVVASESISLGNNTVTLPGLGSCIALSLAQQNWLYLGFAVLAMCCIIIIYNFIIFNPLIVWSDKFRYEMTKSDATRSNIIVDILSRSTVANFLGKIWAAISDFIIDLPFLSWRSGRMRPYNQVVYVKASHKMIFNILWYIFIVLCSIYFARYVYLFLKNSIGMNDIKIVLELTMKTFSRVILLVLAVSTILVPLGIYIGISPGLTTIVQPLIQFLASFPANLFFPIAVIYIGEYELDPDIWLSPLMIIGPMWYILFNVIAGAALIPTEMREAYKLFGIKKWLWWKEVAIPAILPSYITGAITASGGAWNASIIAEAVSWGDKHLYADGIGAYVAKATTVGDFSHIALGIIAMSFMVVVFNKLFWQPLYNYTIHKYAY
ncbi:MAG: hypothetical protein RLZZ59_197 [Pseudomonadota bacterium]|jgi:NitT/TauT family transport system permease protein